MDRVRARVQRVTELLVGFPLTRSTSTNRAPQIVLCLITLLFVVAVSHFLIEEHERVASSSWVAMGLRAFVISLIATKPVRLLRTYMNYHNGAGANKRKSICLCAHD